MSYYYSNGAFGYARAVEDMHGLEQSVGFARTELEECEARLAAAKAAVEKFEQENPGARTALALARAVSGRVL